MRWNADPWHSAVDANNQELQKQAFQEFIDKGEDKVTVIARGLYYIVQNKGDN